MSSELGLTSSRKLPEGWAEGLADLNRGLRRRASALTGLLWAGLLATHWMKLICQYASCGDSVDTHALGFFAADPSAGLS